MYFNVEDIQIQDNTQRTKFNSGHNPWEMAQIQNVTQKLFICEFIRHISLSLFNFAFDAN